VNININKELIYGVKNGCWDVLMSWTFMIMAWDGAAFLLWAQRARPKGRGAQLWQGLPTQSVMVHADEHLGNESALIAKGIAIPGSRVL
jgi:hypothetical protein